MKPIDLKEDGWKWEAFDVEHCFTPEKALAAGECENYQACVVNMMLCGVWEKKESSRSFLFYGNRQVFIRFTRLSDGARMTEWGNTYYDKSIMEGHPRRLPGTPNG